MRLLNGVAVFATLFVASQAYAFEIPSCGGPAVKAKDLFANSGASTQATPLEIEFASILLENEARGGSVAYCLSDAQMSSGKNGLSFGYFQYDLAANPQAKTILADILASTAGLSDAVITDEDVAAIRAGGLSQRAPTLRASRSRSLRELIERVNTSLSTQLGAAEINADFRIGLRRTIASNGQRIDDIDDRVGAKTLLKSSNVARLMLLDYENFFGSIQDKFKAYLQGRSVELAAGTITIESPASFTDIVNFYLSGKQGSGPRNDQRAECLRRINNVVKYYEAAEGPVPLSKRDKVYLVTVLTPILNANDNRYIVRKRENNQYDSLFKLINRASIE